MGKGRYRRVSLSDVIDDLSVLNLTQPNVAGGSSVNKWNGRPYTQSYYDILEERKTLPIWRHKDDFFQTLKANQTLIIIGDTGSGKSTQVSLFVGVYCGDILNILFYNLFFCIIMFYLKYFLILSSKI